MNEYLAKEPICEWKNKLSIFKENYGKDPKIDSNARL